MSEMSDHGTVFVFTGTGGSGRKTIARRLADELGLTHVISYTTREPRPHEANGREYHFIARKEFIEADIHGEFIQSAEIDNHFYGIKKADIQAALNQNTAVYVIVNRYGANKLKYEFGARAIRLFIYVSKQTILERMQSRDVAEDIVRHYMDHYTEEVLYRKECEYVFENMELSATMDAVRTTLLAYIPAKTG